MGVVVAKVKSEVVVELIPKNAFGVLRLWVEETMKFSVETELVTHPAGRVLLITFSSRRLVVGNQVPSFIFTVNE